MLSHCHIDIYAIHTSELQVLKCVPTLFILLYCMLFTSVCVLFYAEFVLLVYLVWIRIGIKMHCMYMYLTVSDWCYLIW